MKIKHLVINNEIQSIVWDPDNIKVFKLWDWYINSNDNIQILQEAVDYTLEWWMAIISSWSSNYFPYYTKLSTWIYKKLVNNYMTWQSWTWFDYEVLSIELSNWVVTWANISTSWWDQKVLCTNVNYSTPYTPQYNWSPATKKYVDDSVSWAVSKWTTAPSSPAEWQLWYDTTNDVLKIYDWTNWNEVWWWEIYTAWEWIEIWTYDDYSAMRWPCPEGFHVPLQTERQWVKTIMNWLSLTIWDNWRTNLHMPFAGGRNSYDASLINQSSYGNYWSSSPYLSQSTTALTLHLETSTVDVNYNVNCANGYPVRCFKDLYVAPTSSWTVVQWTLWSAWIFWNQTQWLISITNGSTGYTIMDKNLWATVVYSDWDTLTEANMGYMYQWWNNYWFPSTWTISKTSSTKVDASAYWPTNPYSSDTFIRWNQLWSLVRNNNLRWATTWVVTLENAITNTWVLSVNWQTWDVTIDASEASSITTTQPSNPVEWDVYYDTTNDVVKIYDWTNWNEVGGGSDDVNTKTFYISSTSDLTNAQAAYDWYVAGKNPIVVYWTEKPIYIVYDTSNWLRFRSSDNKKSWTTTSTMVNYWRMLNLVVSNWTVTSISTWDYTGNAINVLSTGINYSTPYTPQYDWSPATKKYVDDSVVEYNAGEGIEIWTVQDYSAMQWPAPDGFHVPSKDEWVALCWVLTTTFSMAANKSTLENYLKMPGASYRQYNSYKYQWEWCYYWSSTNANRQQAYKLVASDSSLNPSDYTYTHTIWANIRPFKDSPIIPDSSWTTLYDWSSIIVWAWIFHNTSLWLISISWDWQNRITISDKNLWATIVFNSWDTKNESNCWKYYQRWNNYWFSYSLTTITDISSTQVDTTWYWPWNYYSSSTWNNKNWSWFSPTNDNLRWWVTWVVTLENAITNTGVLSVNWQTGDVAISEWEMNNVKEFTLSSLNDLTNAQAAYDWYVNW